MPSLGPDFRKISDWVEFAVVFLAYRLDGLHMATDHEFQIETLSEDQICELVKYIFEEFGSGLSQEELDESIGVVMENVPGLETESTQEIQRLIESIRRKYDDEIQYIRDQD
jgi:hypothetical protein